MTNFYSRLDNTKRLSIIAGPCVFESHDLSIEIASKLFEICEKHNVNYCFKMSFDKANRTSGNSYRGADLDVVNNVFEEVQCTLGIDTLTDIHERDHAEDTCADILQIPAFLCRQTDLIVAAANTGKVVNIKKGQFLSPPEMKNVVEKVTATGNKRVIQTERGSSFGYNNLVVDMRGLDIMKQNDFPVVIDCTHAVQQPGGQGTSSGGDRTFAPTIAKAAVATGIAGVFMEVHPDPDSSPSDGANMIRLQDFEEILQTLLNIDGAVK